MEGCGLCPPRPRRNNNGKPTDDLQSNDVTNEFLQPNVSIKPTDSNVPGAYLVYNEYIAYDVDQIRLRYLFRVKMGR